MAMDESPRLSPGDTAVPAQPASGDAALRPGRAARTWRRRLLALGVLLVALAAMVVAALFLVELVLQDRFAQNLYREARRRPPHPFLQVLPSYQVLCNSSGFRGDPITEEKQPASVRLFALGGSTTLGVTNRYEDTYPYKLQSKLRDRYPAARIEVQNAGGGWYSTAHILTNYELRVRPYAPDVVVVFEAINDLYRSFSPPWFAAGPFKPDYAHFLGPYARLLGPDVDAVSDKLRPLGSEWLLRRTLERWFRGDPTPYDYHRENVAKVTAQLRPRAVNQFRSLPSFCRNYQRLVRNMKADGVRVVVASQPFLYARDLSPADRSLIYYPQIFCAEDGFYPTLESMIAGMQQYNAEARAIAAAEGVAFLDFERLVPKTGRFFSDDVHLRAAGNEMLAQAVADWVMSERFIPSRARKR